MQIRHIHYPEWSKTVDKETMRMDDLIETRHSLLKLLQYVEDECARIGLSASTWMIAISRNTLESEATNPYSAQFGKFTPPSRH